MIYLAETDTSLSFVKKDAVRSLLLSPPVKVSLVDLNFTYEDVTYDEALTRLLPAGVQVPHSFETVGHIAHLNLKDDQEPHRHIMGRVS